LREESATAIPVLVKLTTHKNVKVRAAAVDALASTRDPQVISLLLKLARTDSDWNVQQTALLSLTLLHEKMKAYIPDLIEIGTTTNPKYEDLKGDAFTVLSRLGAMVVPDLVRLIDDPKSSTGTRSSAIRCISDTASYPCGKEAKGAVPCLIRVLGDKNHELQSASARALGQIGLSAKESIPSLENLLKIADKSVRLDAAYAILQLDSSHQAGMTTLIELVQQKQDPDTRFQALAGLGRFAAGAGHAVPSLISLLDEPDVQFRSKACDVLGDIPKEGKTAIPKLMQLSAGDPSPYVRKAADSALQRLNKKLP
jgi:HEAT repeat protein